MPRPFKPGFLGALIIGLIAWSCATDPATGVGAARAAGAPAHALAAQAHAPLDDVERSVISTRGLSRRASQVERDRQPVRAAETAIGAPEALAAGPGSAVPEFDAQLSLIACGSTSACATAVPPPLQA